MKQPDYRLVLVVAGLGALAWLGYKAVKVAPQVADAVNPASTTNAVTKAADGITKVLTGDDNTTLGGWLFDKLNPGSPTNAANLNAPPTQEAIDALALLRQQQGIVPIAGKVNGSPVLKAPPKNLEDLYGEQSMFPVGVPIWVGS